MFDFVEHNLSIHTSEGITKALPLVPRSVAAFYREFMACLHVLGIQVTINTLPSEVQHPIRCDIDEVHSSYDPVHVQRFWRILVQTDAVLRRYRSPFLGKSSPIHFFLPGISLASPRCFTYNILSVMKGQSASVKDLEKGRALWTIKFCRM